MNGLYKQCASRRDGHSPHMLYRSIEDSACIMDAFARDLGGGSLQLEKLTPSKMFLEFGILFNKITIALEQQLRKF